MNFRNIYEMQKELDKAIHKEHKVTAKQVEDKRVAALLVEVGEFANEIKPFKYWKKDKKIAKEKMLEEFVDGIHFFASLGNFVGSTPVIEPVIVSKDQTIQLLEVYGAISSLKDGVSEATLNRAFSLYMGLARLVGITDKQIEDHYVRKNKINYERIANNY